MSVKIQCDKCGSIVLQKDSYFAKTFFGEFPSSGFIAKIDMCKDCYIKFSYTKDSGVIMIPDSGIGNVSDGYHTFNELYHHRAVLFSVICNTFPERAWKSKLHHDGTMYDGMFIVGFETGAGQATYHYDVEPYWDMFEVLELKQAPEWDGHSPDDAIARLNFFGECTANGDILRVPDRPFMDYTDFVAPEYERITVAEDGDE